MQRGVDLSLEKELIRKMGDGQSVRVSHGTLLLSKSPLISLGNSPSSLDHYEVRLLSKEGKSCTAQPFTVSYLTDWETRALN